MKLSNKYIAFASVALLMASCDLDKFPEGDYISEEQKEDIINGRPNLITAEVNAMAAKLNTFGTISDDATTYHNDYGIPAVSMILESGGRIWLHWLMDITGLIHLRIIVTEYTIVQAMN